MIKRRTKAKTALGNKGSVHVCTGTHWNKHLPVLTGFEQIAPGLGDSGAKIGFSSILLIVLQPENDG
jgi:hypothetical protein